MYVDSIVFRTKLDRNRIVASSTDDVDAANGRLTVLVIRAVDVN